MATTTAEAANNSAAGRQIPIVCPGHTRPLADLQSFYVAAEQRSFLVSACHGMRERDVCVNSISDLVLIHPFSLYIRMLDKHPMLRDGTTGDWIGSFVGHKGAVWSARVDATGNLVATAGGDFAVQVWDGITGKSLRTYAHGHIVKAVAFSSPSASNQYKCWLATGGHEGLLRLYDLTPNASSPKTVGKEEATFSIAVQPAASSESTNKKGSKIVITKLEWDQDKLWVGASDGALRLYHVTADNEPTLIQTVVVGPKEIRDLEIRRALPDGTTRLTVASGNTVTFYQLSTETSEATLLKQIAMPVHFTEEGGASLHPAGHVFCTGGNLLWVYVFDYATGKELDCYKGHHGPIRCVRYMEPAGDLFASGSEDGTIRLWKNMYPPSK